MIPVLNVPFYDKDIAMAVAEVVQGISSGTSKNKNLCISATGAHGLIEAHKDPDFNCVLQDFHLNLPDGMPVVWIGRLKGASQMRRCYGPDFFEELMRSTANLPIHHFFCGGKEGVAAELKEVVRLKFSNHRVSGHYSPPFREMTDVEMRELGQQITASGAHIVWIGISTPKQEKFAKRLAQFVLTDCIITVGAAFDFHTGRVKQAPKWMQNAGLEWFFRLLMEPKRLYKRYFEIVPKFIWLNIKEFIDFYIYKKRHI
jgi:N-acetylglucosaminyldiphosphoundecaprenol N-acetyl-beta-D-mannosaminyltransferase